MESYLEALKVERAGLQARVDTTDDEVTRAVLLGRIDHLEDEMRRVAGPQVPEVGTKVEVEKRPATDSEKRR